jgi:hypothetical protein
MNINRINSILEGIHKNLDIINIEVRKLDSDIASQEFYKFEIGILKSIRRFRKTFGIIDEEILNDSTEEGQK